MESIEERAHSAEKEWLLSEDVTRYGYEQGYIKGAIDQQKIDIEKAWQWMQKHIKLIGSPMELRISFKQAMEE